MYKRVLLKLSGEALAAGRGFGIDAVFVNEVAEEIAEVARSGCQIGIVVGGGNFFRGVAEQAIDMDRVAADHMGMLSTVINAIALQDAIEKTGALLPRHERHRHAPGRRALHPPPRHPPPRKRPHRHLRRRHRQPLLLHRHRRRLRAMEIRADVLLKATSVDGIYTADPKKDPNAVKFEEITYMEILRLGLKVMDTTAVSLCKDNNMPMIIFSMREPATSPASSPAKNSARSSPPSRVTVSVCHSPGNLRFLLRLQLLQTQHRSPPCPQPSAARSPSCRLGRHGRCCHRAHADYRASAAQPLQAP